MLVVNEYRAAPGRLMVDKRMIGDAADRRGAVAVSVTCTDGTAATLHYPPGRTVRPYVIGGIAATAVCTVSEVQSGAVPGVVVEQRMAPAGPVVVHAGATARVIVTNEFTTEPGVTTTDPGVTTTTTGSGVLPTTGVGGSITAPALLLIALGALLTLTVTIRRHPHP